MHIGPTTYSWGHIIDVEVKVLSFNKDEKKLGLALTEFMEPKEKNEEEAETEAE